MQDGFYRVSQMSLKEECDSDVVSSLGLTPALPVQLQSSRSLSRNLHVTSSERTQSVRTAVSHGQGVLQASRTVDAGGQQSSTCGGGYGSGELRLPGASGLGASVFNIGAEGAQDRSERGTEGGGKEGRGSGAGGEALPQETRGGRFEKWRSKREEGEAQLVETLASTSGPGGAGPCVRKSEHGGSRREQRSTDNESPMTLMERSPPNGVAPVNVTAMGGVEAAMKQWHSLGRGKGSPAMQVDAGDSCGSQRSQGSRSRQNVGHIVVGQACVPEGKIMAERMEEGYVEDQEEDGETLFIDISA